MKSVMRIHDGCKYTSFSGQFQFGRNQPSIKYRLHEQLAFANVTGSMLQRRHRETEFIMRSGRKHILRKVFERWNLFTSNAQNDRKVLFRAVQLWSNRLKRITWNGWAYVMRTTRLRKMQSIFNYWVKQTQNEKLIDIDATYRSKGKFKRISAKAKYLYHWKNVVESTKRQWEYANSYVAKKMHRRKQMEYAFAALHEHVLTLKRWRKASNVLENVHFQQLWKRFILHSEIVKLEDAEQKAIVADMYHRKCLHKSFRLWHFAHCENRYREVRSWWNQWLDYVYLRSIIRRVASRYLQFDVVNAFQTWFHASFSVLDEELTPNRLNWDVNRSRRNYFKSPFIEQRLERLRNQLKYDPSQLRTSKGSVSSHSQDSIMSFLNNIYGSDAMNAYQIKSLDETNSPERGTAWDRMQVRGYSKHMRLLSDLDNTADNARVPDLEARIYSGRPYSEFVRFSSPGDSNQTTYSRSVTCNTTMVSSLDEYEKNSIPEKLFTDSSSGSSGTFTSDSERDFDEDSESSSSDWSYSYDSDSDILSIQ